MWRKEVYNKVAEQFKLPPEEVEKIYNTFWRYIKEEISKIKIEEDMSEEEFKRKTPSFNLPSLGKLFANYNVYKLRLEKHKKEEYED